MASRTSIDVLLSLAADNPATVLSTLQNQPHLASQRDSHGYSLLHAAVSYDHHALLETLIQTYHVDPNLLDEDGETCLFNAETVASAKEALRLGVDASIRNHDGLTAAEKLADEDEQPLVAAFLNEAAGASASEGHAAETLTQLNGVASSSAETQAGTSPDSASSDPLRRPPRLPEGLQVNLGTMLADEAGEAPDPEFRRRIEELAARPDFESEETQRELRRLVEDAVSGLHEEGEEEGHVASRRRVG